MYIFKQPVRIFLFPLKIILTYHKLKKLYKCLDAATSHLVTLNHFLSTVFHIFLFVLVFVGSIVETDVHEWD